MTMDLAWLDERLWFPDPRRASREGFVAVGGDMSVERLLLAYKSGIFPWTDDPITWWSPEPRAIFELDQFHISRSLKLFLKKDLYQITYDTAFEQVMQACAQVPRHEQTTWISPYFIESYTAMYRAGWAHSVETWHEGKLVGGVYGVAIGGFFAGESMFHTAPNASKVALVGLVKRLRERGFTLFDTQMTTPATIQMGATEIPRIEYLNRLSKAIQLPCRFD
ncbi:leucyl/phenylalanyl-tRNA--protein transferase [Bryobacterales bacterium F-183]|nr:leucyl/phenylalanyl-tRNA--protein transferase [Bryobacterales bacterium F-183]